MASFAQRTKRKRSRRKKNAGHARKIKLSRKAILKEQREALKQGKH